MRFRISEAVAWWAGGRVPPPETKKKGAPQAPELLNGVPKALKSERNKLLGIGPNSLFYYVMSSIESVKVSKSQKIGVCLKQPKKIATSNIDH